MKKLFALMIAGSVLAGCEVPQGGNLTAAPDPSHTSRKAARAFLRVVNTVEPVAERECRARSPERSCDFRIFIDDRPDQPPNAFQTIDNSGRPAIGFTLSLIAEAQNEDELAFILGHEAAHHINGHIERTVQNARVGAVVLKGLATLGGADVGTINRAAAAGAAIGARSYSKDYELEADQLGALITYQAGYDPLRGARFFARIPDPGDKFLGTHPPNAARLDIVRQTVSGF